MKRKRRSTRRTPKLRRASGQFSRAAGTYLKIHHLNSRARLDRFEDMLLVGIRDAGAEIHAWSVFSNHYHVVLSMVAKPERIREVLTDLHDASANEINADDGIAGRKVWYQFWDTALTFQKSYLARLNYVHTNPVKHGLVAKASNYPWCSAGWFEREARPSLVKTVYSLKTDRINVKDPYDPILPE
ncbi:MAG: transposase [Thermoanaerobaculia bacterium]